MSNSRTAQLAPGEQARIDAALDQLEKDTDSPREITVRFVLNIHREYPKVVGDVTVNSAEEEKALLDKKAAEAVAEAPAPETAKDWIEPAASVTDSAE